VAPIPVPVDVKHLSLPVLQAPTCP
jgi:hypothetical protein